MGADDNDIVERALNAAEAKLGDPKEEGFGPEPVAEEPAVEDAPSAPPVEEEPAVEPKVEAKPSKKASKQVSDQVADVEQKETVVESTESTPSIELPAFWSAEMKAAVAKGSKEDVVKHFTQYDQQRTDWANQVARESERGKAYEKRLNEIFEPRRAKLLANRVKDPFDAVEFLLGWNDVFEQDPKTGIVDLMRKNGLTPQDLLGDTGQNQYQDPTILEMQQSIEEMREQAEESKRQLEEQRGRQLYSYVERFKHGKDSYGNVRKEFAELYADRIDQAALQIQQAYPQMPLEELLNHSYEFVLGEARKAHGIQNPIKPTPQPKTREQIIADSKKAQAAASGITGSPANGISAPRPKLKGKDFRDKLSNLVDDIDSRMSAR